MEVIVEREGCDDACMFVPQGCGLAAFKREVCAQLDLHAVVDWDFYVKAVGDGDTGGGCDVGACILLEDDYLSSPLAMDATGRRRVEMRLKWEVVAREQLRALLTTTAPVGDSGTVADACPTGVPINEANWEVLCLSEDTELTRRILHLVIAGKVLPYDVITAAMCEACGAGDVATATRLIAAGVDANMFLPHRPDRTPMYTGYTPLMVAVERDSGLLRGIEPGENEGTGDTPAAVTFTERLLFLGADPNVVCPYDGATALYIAARRGAIRLCERLLAHGAEAALANKRTAASPAPLPPLHAAALCGEQGAPLCRLLIAHGADPNDETAAGQTALMAAAQKADGADVCDALIEGGANPNQQNRTGWTAMLVAAKYGTPLVCARLAKLGGDVNAQLRDGRTPLMLAVVKGFRKVCEALLEAGADVALRLADGAIALFHAVAYRRREICSLLLAHGSEVDARLTEDLTTPLIVAAGNEDFNICALLVRYGADVNARSRDGTTPMHAYASTPMMEKGEDGTSVGELLVRHGADVQARNHAGSTPLLQCVIDGRADACRVLVRECGADVNHAKENGWTLLMSAAAAGDARVCRELLALGAAFDARTQDGRTPLSIAQHMGHDAAAAMLTAAGAVV